MDFESISYLNYGGGGADEEKNARISILSELRRSAF
jgi:hypothetical protein